MNTLIKNRTAKLIELLKDSSLEEKVDALNYIRERLHEVSPFKSEPVDFVRWVKNDKVIANDYNPNKVAPPKCNFWRCPS